MAADKIGYRRLQTEAYLNLSRIHREMEQRVQLLFEERGLDDVTPAQANVLMILFQEREPLTARKLAALMALHEMTVGRFVHALERSGWVERSRDPADGRAWLIHPTRKAYAALPRFIEVSNALLDEAFAGLDPQQISELGVVVERVRENLDPVAGQRSSS